MPATATDSQTRLRLRFAKTGDLRFLSHHDLLRCLERILRRCDLPVARSQGFNPRYKLSFPLALALGVEGLQELLELDLTQPLLPELVLDALRQESPAGLEFLTCVEVPRGRAIQVTAVTYALPLPSDRVESTRRAVACLLAQSQIPYTRQRPDGARSIDLRPFLLDLRVTSDATLDTRLRVTPLGGVRFEEILDVLGLRDLLELGSVPVRREVEIERQDLSIDAPGSPLSADRPERLADTTGSQPESPIV